MTYATGWPPGYTPVAAEWQIAEKRIGRPSLTPWACYEARKAEFLRRNPDASPDQIERACKAAAAAVGV